MKTLTLHTSLILLLLVSMNAYGKTTNQSIDVLEKATTMNSKHHPVPTTSYRKGHVSHHPVKQYTKINKQGYVIIQDGTIGSASKARATSAPTIIDNQIYYTKRTDKHQGNVKESIASGKKDQLDHVATFYEKNADYLNEKIQRQSELDQKSKNLDAGNGFSSTPQASGYQKAYKNVGQGSVSSMQSFQGSRILNYQKKNYSTMGDELICTDSTSGKIFWRKKFKGNIKKSGGFLATPPVAVNQQIIVARLNGDIEQFKANTGKLEKRYQLNVPIRFQPIVQDGKIFIGTQDGRLICVDTGDPKLTGWPTWGRDAAHTGIVR